MAHPKLTVPSEPPGGAMLSGSQVGAAPVRFCDEVGVCAHALRPAGQTSLPDRPPSPPGPPCRAGVPLSRWRPSPAAPVGTARGRVVLLCQDSCLRHGLRLPATGKTQVAKGSPELRPTPPQGNQTFLVFSQHLLPAHRLPCASCPPLGAAAMPAGRAGGGRQGRSAAASPRGHL